MPDRKVRVAGLDNRSGRESSADVQVPRLPEADRLYHWSMMVAAYGIDSGL
jgi:hypothetical protein